MENSYDFFAPLGYPKVTAELLLDAGLGFEFAHFFAITYERLPRWCTCSADPGCLAHHADQLLGIAPANILAVRARGARSGVASNSSSSRRSAPTSGCAARTATA